MKNLYLITLILIAFSCNDKKEEKDFNENDKLIIENKKEPKTENVLSEEKTKIQLEDTTSKTYVALKFINDYVANSNKMKEQIGIIEWVNSNQDVSQEFKGELTKMIGDAYESEPEYGLGFDPIFDAQDYPDDGFKLAEFDSISNYLTVEAKTWKGFVIKMKIKEVNNKWLVDGCGVINIPKNKQAQR
ncbi:hypothetical protein DFQ09_1182 [Winogradskyella pacifica]|uniref:DUF3828 domain-containing protein n=1 Tax=Winogradskyella pacifica TaxID=664642 RepID=A0A3D9LLT9_9FLAO|nr:hypothetical protein [Winogradskyella pacifica]REE07616.1 hypothetical protein DFQ09_1182 [Winogradskyella pacifica]